MKSADVLARLERHWIKPGELYPGGVFLPEVTLGRSGGPRADALFVGFTTTRGRLLYGHEIKVSRSDWLHELAQPDKAEAWESQCHAWWLVTPDESIVRPGELPPGWGWMTCDGKSKTRLSVQVKADIHRDRQPSWEACLSIASRQDTLRGQAVASVRYAAENEARVEVERRVADQVQLREQHRDPGAAAARAEVALYRQALGVELTERSYSFHDREVTADTVRAIGEILRVEQRVDQAARQAFSRHAGTELRGLRQRLDDLERALTRYRVLTGHGPEKPGG